MWSPDSQTGTMEPSATCATNTCFAGRISWRQGLCHLRQIPSALERVRKAWLPEHAISRKNSFGRGGAVVLGLFLAPTLFSFYGTRGFEYQASLLQIDVAAVSQHLEDAALTSRTCTFYRKPLPNAEMHSSLHGSFEMQGAHIRDFTLHAASNNRGLDTNEPATVCCKCNLTFC